MLLVPSFSLQDEHGLRFFFLYLFFCPRRLQKTPDPRLGNKEQLAAVFLSSFSFFFPSLSYFHPSLLSSFLMLPFFFPSFFLIALPSSFLLPNSNTSSFSFHPFCPFLPYSFLLINSSFFIFLLLSVLILPFSSFYYPHPPFSSPPSIPPAEEAGQPISLTSCHGCCRSLCLCSVSSGLVLLLASTLSPSVLETCELVSACVCVCARASLQVHPSLLAPERMSGVLSAEGAASCHFWAFFSSSLFEMNNKRPLNASPRGHPAS